MNKTAERRVSLHVPQQYHALYRKVQSPKCTRSQAIKAMCLECMGWMKGEVARCTSEACPLYRFRPYKPKDD